MLLADRRRDRHHRAGPAEVEGHDSRRVRGAGRAHHGALTGSALRQPAQVPTISSVWDVGEAVRGGDRGGPSLHRRTLDLDRRATGAADQVMVVGVGAAAVDRLAVLVAQDVDQAVVGVQREGPVDGGEPDRDPARAAARAPAGRSGSRRRRSSASRTACRWGVVRGAPASEPGSVLVVVAAVHRVPVAVVDVVDVVAVLDRVVAALVAVHVLMRLLGLLVQRQGRSATGNGSGSRRRLRQDPTGQAATKPASATSTIVAPGGTSRKLRPTPASDASAAQHHRGQHRGAEAAGELLRRRDRHDHQRADQQQPDRAHGHADRDRGDHGPSIL